jgi:hypothetical protein
MINIFKKQNGMGIIGEEEKQLKKAFGKQYEDYMENVDRLVPFIKPGWRRSTPSYEQNRID